MITKEQAVALTSRATLHHVLLKNKDGTPIRARVNGRCRVWATRPNAFELPMKYSIRTCFYLSNNNAASWELPA